MNHELVSHARSGELVVFAGAGVSAGNPSALPGWNPLNVSIVEVLFDRLETGLGRKGWISELRPVIEAHRDGGKFPPEYQAQLIEEFCGDRYFRALQSLDISTFNGGHDGIAALAEAGALCAVVTTNFDRLIELALERRGVAYTVARNDAEFVAMSERLARGSCDELPVLKVHGCVSDHLSMIDTLKQRKLGRSRHLTACIDCLQSGYWMYLGFSAADLESDKSYLGLVAGAARSAGATYLAYPGAPELGVGAKTLMAEFGDRGEIVVAHIASYLVALCVALGRAAPVPIESENAVGPAEVRSNLQSWAESLTLSAAALCVAGILESVGGAETAVRILDRIVRKEVQERGSPDYPSAQLHYGRLGAAWGRFIAVPDINGLPSNASVETQQSLMRLSGTDLAFAANTWLACVWLWIGEGNQASAVAKAILAGLVDNDWGDVRPRNREEVADAWVSAAQVFILNLSSDSGTAVEITAEPALDAARRSGDVVRVARVAALRCLVLAKSDIDIPALAAEFDAEFTEAGRVGDGLAMGMRALALGRWHVSKGGLKLAQATDAQAVAEAALDHLGAAVGYFTSQGMHPWIVYARIQQTKALADLHRWDDCQACIEAAEEGRKRFPILTSHFREAYAQVLAMHQDPDALKWFRGALESAEEHGLDERAKHVRLVLEQAEAQFS